MKKEEIMNLGFIENNWSDKGVLSYIGYQKGELLIQCLNNGKYAIDGTDVIIKDIEHLKLCDMAFNYKKIKVLQEKRKPDPRGENPPKHHSMD